jgi:aminotransferase EvaB
VKVPFSYLKDKFGPETLRTRVFADFTKLLDDGDFTLGGAVTEFERRFAQLIGVKHAIGVANGTDALRISLKLAGVGPGDEVITGAQSFIASAGAIAELGAKPVFVDMEPYRFVLDATKVQAAITKKTKAILPVHYTGEPANMDSLLTLGLPVIEDACQAVLAKYHGKSCGTIGLAGCFSLHPLKNLNVWGDGGFITTNDDEFAARVRLYRNHGLKDRDHVEVFGCNSRLDTLQAYVGLQLIGEVPRTTEVRRWNAAYLDKQLTLVDLPGAPIKLPQKIPGVESCYHLYMFEVPPTHREGLVHYLNENGVEAKVHYPIPMYRQRPFGFPERDLPNADRQAACVVTLPIHEHLTKEQLEYAAKMVRQYFIDRPVKSWHGDVK